MNKIKIIIDEGGMLQGVYVSPEIGDVEVGVIDCCTNDEERLIEAGQQYNDCLEETREGKLINIY